MGGDGKGKKEGEKGDRKEREGRGEKKKRGKSAAERRDIDEEVWLFLVPPCGTHCHRPIADTNLVQCSLENRAVLQSLSNATIMPP